MVENNTFLANATSGLQNVAETYVTQPPFTIIYNTMPIVTDQ